MMEEMHVKADNIIRAEDFLNDMMEDDEEKQSEPYISLPRVKRQVHDSFSGLHDSFSGLTRQISGRSATSRNNGSFTCSPPLRTTSSSGSVLQNFWQGTFRGNDHNNNNQVNLMDTHLARLSYESHPMGEGRLIGQTRLGVAGGGMEDVYLDEPSRRGLRKPRGGVNGPFRDNTRSRKTKQRTAMFIMLFVGFFLASMGLYATMAFVKSRKGNNNDINNNSEEVEVPKLVIPSDSKAANDGDLLEAEAMALEAVKHMEEEEENPATPPAVDTAAANEEETAPEAQQVSQQQKSLDYYATQEEEMVEAATTPEVGEEEPSLLFQDTEHQPQSVNAVEEETTEEEKVAAPKEEDEEQEDTNDNTDEEEEEDVVEVDLEGEDTDADLLAEVEQDYDEEIKTVQSEEEDVEQEMEVADTPRQTDLLQREEDTLQNLEEVVAEEKEVFEEEQEAVNSEDYALLEQEAVNLQKQEDNVAKEASLLGDMEFARGEEVEEKRQEEEALEKTEDKLREDQQAILRQEAKIEGWDYDKAKELANQPKSQAEDAKVVVPEEEVTVPMEARRADEPQPKEEAETVQDEGEDGQ